MQFDAPFLTQRRGHVLRSSADSRRVPAVVVLPVIVLAVALAGSGAILTGLAATEAAAAERAAGVASPKEIRELLDEAAGLLAEGKASKAADRAAEAARNIDALAKQDRIPSGLRSLWDRCRTLRDDIALEGVDVDRIVLTPFKQSAAKGTDPAAGASPQAAAMPAASMPAAKKPAAASAAVSFSREVAPLLARHCGSCHIAGRKGGFQMVSYAGLMKTGVVQPGTGEASRLVEVILSGDMPRGGGKVSPDEVGVLMRWIDGGAPFDGPDPSLPFDAMARQASAAAAATPPQPTAVKLKPGELSFAADVAPVLLEHCAGCHDANNPESNLSMATFERLVRGGRGGSPLVAGKGAESLLVKKIKGAGIEGQRMPLGKDPLSDDVIATIQTWIDQGNKLDMLTPKDDLAAVVAAGRARKLSHAALRPVRFEAGRTLWTRAIPDERPSVEERGDVLVVGNLPAQRLGDLAERVESVAHRLEDDIAGGSTVVKGGLVVYAFAKPYDFSSFWQTVWSDERPKGVTSGAGVAGDVVYAALVATADGSAETADMTAALTEQMAAAALLGRGAPAWFARGVGRALAIKAVPKAADVQKWRRELPGAVQRMGSVADVMAGRGDPEVMAVVAGGFVTTLSTGSRLAAVAKQMDDGESFEQAFQKVFRTAPQAAFEAWCTQQSRGGKK